MATAYGNSISSKWRSYLDYSTSTSNTAVTITGSAAGFQSQSWGFDLSGVPCTMTLGSSSWSGSGSVSTSSGATTKVKLVGSHSVTINRTHSAQSITVKAVVNRSGASYYGGTSTASATVTVPAKPSYTVAFNANGGSGAPSSQTKWYGETLTLSTTKPTRTGYTFKGWATSASGSVVYASGGSYTANSGATLYAVWQVNTYTVSYNGNKPSGASGSVSNVPSSQTKTYGTTLTLSSTTPTLTGYTFKGWATSASSTTVAYKAGGSYTANSAATLYAVWQINTWAVAYDANGGSGAPSSQNKTYNQSLTLSSAVPSRDGYNFTEWNTASDGTGTSYSPGGSYTGNAALTLYAIWELAYNPPTISNLSVLRWDSTDDSADDEGTSCHVSLSWTVDSTDSGTITSVTVNTRASGGSTWETTETITVTGTTSGTAEGTLAGTYSITTSYDVLVTVTDSHGMTRSVSTILSPSFFTMDVLAGGRGMAIGKACTQAGLEVAWDTAFDGDVYLAHNKRIYGTNSNGESKYVFEPRNASDNCAINYLGYAESNSDTEIYGNKVYLVARDGVLLNGKYLPKGDVSVGHWTNSSAVTTTSSATIGSFSHTSQSGKVLIIADLTLQTSRYTSAMNVYAGSTYVGGARTNLTSPTRVVDIRHHTPTRGTAITYSLCMSSQDTGTTATFPAYNTAELIVIDI